MPHIWLKNPNIDNLSSKEVIFCGTNDYDETLIALNFKNLNFALVLKRKDNRYLLKYDKPSRPSDTMLLKEAISFIASKLGGEIVSDNTKGGKNYSLENLIEPECFDIKSFENKKIFIEIGFGSGLHLENLAKNNKDNAYIGIEIYKPAIYKFLNRCNLNNVHNAYAIDEDARVFLDTLPYSSLDGIYVHFPVPWPDAPHRRVWSKEFLNASLNVLKENGFVHLRTDDKEYFEFAKEVANDLNLNYEFAVNEPLEIVSKYEARWQRQNKDIYDLVVLNRQVVNCDKSAYNFTFEQLPDFEKTVAKDGILVACKKPYIDLIGNKVYKVAFGATNKPKMYYVFVKDSRAFYWPKEPLLSDTNIKAHQILKEEIGSINSCARA